MGAPAAAYHHRQRKARRDSGTLSDCVLHGGVTFKFGSEVEIGGGEVAKHLVVPEVAITAPTDGDSVKGEEKEEEEVEITVEEGEKKT